jgi:hypothetical protein
VKAMAGAVRWLESEGSGRMNVVKQGDLGSRSRARGVRVSVVAKKRRNGRGAKGGRKVET